MPVLVNRSMALRRAALFVAAALLVLRRAGGLKALAASGRRVMAALACELRAVGHALKMLDELCSDPRMYTKTSLRNLVSSFGYHALHEAITNDGTSCEQIAERCLGSGRFSALEGRVALVTGASGGLGLENARVLMKYGCHVIWAVRNPEKARSALRQLEEAQGGPFAGKATILPVELSDLTTVKPFVEAFLALDLPLHYLILNAGIMAPVNWEPSAQGHEKMFATNNLSHFLMTELLMPKLLETAAAPVERSTNLAERDVGAALLGVEGGSGHRPIESLGPRSGDVRIVILSSIAGTMCSDMDVSALPTSKDSYNEFSDYAVTKACDAFHARYLQQQLKGTGISAVAVHPGIITTGLGQGNEGLTSLLYGSAITAPVRKGIPSGAATTMYCALSPDVPRQVREGWFYYYNRSPQTPMGVIKPGHRDDLIQSLHDLQMDLVKPYM